MGGLRDAARRARGQKERDGGVFRVEQEPRAPAFLFRGRLAMKGVKLTWKDDLVAALLAGLVMVVLVATVGNLGYARDEGFYFQAADSYRRWFELLFSNPRAAFEPK